jgi:hypothetical protein
MPLGRNALAFDRPPLTLIFSSLAQDLVKRKTLLMAAKKMSETMKTKIKGLQKDQKTLNKKYSKSQVAVALGREQTMMAEEDARGNAMRFQEVRRTQAVTCVAHKTIHNVFTSVWHHVMPLGDDEEDDDAGGLEMQGGGALVLQDKNARRAALEAKIKAKKEKERKKERALSHLTMSSMLSDVESLWLSPSQISMETILKSVTRVNEVWDEVTHK